MNDVATVRTPADLQALYGQKGIQWVLRFLLTTCKGRLQRLLSPTGAVFAHN
jgi:hypothetical protein